MTNLTLEFDFRGKRYTDAAAGLMAFAQDNTVKWNKMPSVLRRELKNYLDSVALALAKRHGNPYPSGTSQNSLSRRSGDLIDSIKKSVKITGTTFNTIEGQIGSSLVYAKIQEMGGVIRPRQAKYLTIPLPAALNSDGTPKKRSARDWDKTFVIRSKNGSLLIVQKSGSDIVPLYVLKSSVRISPRLNLGNTLNAGLPYFVDKAMEAMLTAMRG